MATEQPVRSVTQTDQCDWWGGRVAGKQQGAPGLLGAPWEPEWAEAEKG